ncbi:MAG: glycosyltransferase family 87 protein [Syntrophobacteraceae bacterium]
MSETTAGERGGAIRPMTPGVEISLGVLTWLAPMLVIALLVALHPERRSVTPVYHAASAAWWTGKDLYRGLGYHYLPQFALLFLPFHWLPVPVGDIVWRFGEAALLAVGVWSLCRQMCLPERSGETSSEEDSCFSLPASRFFLYASLLTMPLCLGALRNGQANAIFAGLWLCAALCLARRNWWAAAVLMALATAIKPLGIVMLLLAAVFYAPVRLRLLAALAVLALFPFLFAPAGYVMGQFHGFFADMKTCAALQQDRFADIGGVFRTFGVELPERLSFMVRFAAGGVFLALWLTGARRLREPFRALWLLALSAAYLMLFNPMNEANSYAILAPALGLWALAALNTPPAGRFGWLTVAISLSMSLLPNILHPLFGNYFALFWHPVMTAIFIGILAWLVLRGVEAWSGKGQTPIGSVVS